MAVTLTFKILAFRNIFVLFSSDGGCVVWLPLEILLNHFHFLAQSPI